MVKVVNIRTYSFGPNDISIPIHRPYALGNPFPLADVNNIIDREECIEKYRQWFYKQISDNNKAILNQLNFLKKLHNENYNVILCCFCAPKKCHGNVIKEWLEL